jgi:hypothetical protein
VNTVRADATVTAEQVPCSVPYFDFYWFSIGLVTVLGYILTAG